jgi:phage-related protein
MIDRTKKLPARFYISRAGRNPVREWILELSSDNRHTVGKDIQKVEFGWPIGRPHCAPLGQSLWEVRSNLDDGRIARVIFAWAMVTWFFCMAL